MQVDDSKSSDKRHLISNGVVTRKCFGTFTEKLLKGLHQHFLLEIMFETHSFRMDNCYNLLDNELLDILISTCFLIGTLFRSIQIVLNFFANHRGREQEI